jgi:hypothetical protein
MGTAEAAFTCPEEAAAFTPGTSQNPSGCLEPSSDIATLQYIGLELSVGQSPQVRTVAPHVAAALNYFQNQFEVNARRFDILNGARQEFIDRTIQKSHATRFSLTGGVALRLGARLQADIDLLYAPLWVRRADAIRQHDDLVTAKALLKYKVR